MKKTLMLMLLVAIVIPIALAFIEKTMFPEVAEHILKRLPFDINNKKIVLLNIIVGTFLEELIYRQLIQTVITKFTSVPFAIIVVSIAFTLMHYSSGQFSIVFFDLLGIFVDSLLYGLIFSRSNILFSWSAHCMSDLVGLLCLLI
ncbi:CPBP family intramembrane glutamic endopeptidase [Clostridium sp. C8-1-8]|uniref:CPBP family intramembrane glutamic endopeptidase n=1 Tax=Clostridium sp. C8-1-8 TaxID=2698831 RepID=UPI00136A97A9|nr:CPBP family intramembrane glutamic endopeptidase [Clostridium sp. C8-1-8]